MPPVFCAKIRAASGLWFVLICLHQNSDHAFVYKLCLRMRSYINRGDSFVSPSAVGNMPKLRVDNLSLSASFLYMSAGLEVGAHREESQYNHLKALLRSFQNHRFLFCLDGLSSAHSQVKSMAQLLLSHREDLERALYGRYYFVIITCHTALHNH